MTTEDQAMALGLGFDDEPETTIGMTRVEELENALGDLIDLWDEGILVPNELTGQEDRSLIYQRFDHAAVVLAGGEEED